MMSTGQIKNLPDVAAMKIFAGEVAASLQGGEVLGLVGDLGAGKTTFVQFLAEALGVVGVVRSPTFVLMNVYEVESGKVVERKSGIRRLCHVDAYRLKSEEELKGIGFEEYAGDPATVCVVEWADMVPFIQKLQGYQEIKLVVDGEGRRVER